MSNSITVSKEERDDIRCQCDEFSAMLDKFPPASILEKTPDGRAVTLPISHVESRLDTFFFGQWGTEDFGWQVCQNEILGKITIWVIHPVTGLKITRVGSASVQITVDALDANIKASMTKKEINSYALSIENKKPNSLKLLAGVLKAECFKNAAQSFGKALGKDINRKSVATIQRLSKPKIKENLLTDSNTLNENHRQWENAIAMLARDETTIPQLETRFKISDDTKILLVDEATKYSEKAV